MSAQKMIEQYHAAADKAAAQLKGFVFDDGGRAAAGYMGRTRDCVIRAIAIATEQPYQTVYDAIFALAESTPRNGVRKDVWKGYLRSLGWRYVATMTFGSGCKVHLRADELPPGRLVVQVSRHLCAVINGVIHDNHDPSRDGTRCVYGYFTR